MNLDILTEDDRWNDVDLASVAKRAAAALSAHLGLDASIFSADILACDDARIADLNAEFRQKPTSTNVLSWPSDERGSEVIGDAPEPPDPRFDAELGDIAISFDTCQKEAIESHIPFENHLSHLIIHAILHLLGYDHVEDEDAALMEGIEIAILEKMGIQNPYELSET